KWTVWCWRGGGLNLACASGSASKRLPITISSGGSYAKRAEGLSRATASARRFNVQRTDNAEDVAPVLPAEHWRRSDERKKRVRRREHHPVGHRCAVAPAFDGPDTGAAQ